MNIISPLRAFTIRTRMIGAIAMVVALLIALSAGALYQLYNLADNTEQFVANTHSDFKQLAQLRGELGTVRRQETDALINYYHLEAAAAARVKWQVAIEGVRKSALILAREGKDDGEKAAGTILTHLKAYEQEALPVMKQIEAGTVPTLNAAVELLKPAQGTAALIDDALSSVMRSLSEEEQIAAARHFSVKNTAYTSTGILMLLAIVVVAPLTLANMISICRPIDQAREVAERIAAGNLAPQDLDIAGQDEPAQMLRSLVKMRDSLRATVSDVRQATDSISTASRQIAAGNMDLSSRTEQSASNLQQTAASVEEIAGTVRQSTHSAMQANEMVTSAAEVATRGGDMVSKVVTTMDDINQASRKIVDIIGVIDGIAFQTNILALNAAVEAARAGEQGRGFAVVAGEVRTLAHRSAEAAREIKSLIGASVDKVEVGARLVGAAGTTMQEIVASVQHVSTIIHEISTASSEQNMGIGEVNSAIATLDQMTLQNAALVEESAAAADSLRDQAESLARVVSTFQLS